MEKVIPTARFYDNLRFNLCHVLPYYLLGIFSQRRSFTRLFKLLGIHPFHPRYCNHLRRRYRSDYLYIRMLFRKALLVFDISGVRRVLDRSPSIYAESELKRRGMAHFQPNALTISRGHAWQERRLFNDYVLDSDSTTHKLAGVYLDQIRKAVGNPAPSDWQGFSSLFEEIVQRIVFGAVNADNRRSYRRLMKLMGEANRVFMLKPSKNLSALEHAIRTQIHASEKQSLVAQCPLAPQVALTEPEHQVLHWLFAIGDTLPVNVIRTMLLIISHPHVEQRIRKELSGANLERADGITGLKLLEGCVQEAMRLWPTTAMLAREMVRRDTLGGTVVSAGTTILILNNFLHRDTEIQGNVNSFKPTRWSEDRIHYAYNHLSNGTQVCAGKHLALFVTKAVLATLLSRWRYQAIKPQLQADKSIPYINDYYAIRFRTETINTLSG